MERNTATSNKDVFNEYYDTNNVVTRNSLLGVLESRGDRGDEIAQDYVHVIKQTKELGATILPAPESTKLTDEELLFLATHTLGPDDIARYTLRGTTTGGFVLDGKIYDCVDNVISLDGQVVSVTPEWLVNVMKAYDEKNILTLMRLKSTIGPLVVGTPFTPLSFIREAMVICKYVEENTLDDYVPLQQCPSEYVRRTLVTLAIYGDANIKRVMSESLFKRILRHDVPVHRCLKIKRSITGGVYISDPHLVGIELLINHDRRSKFVDEYTLKLNTDLLDEYATAWGDAHVLNLYTHVSLHLLNLCSTILVGLDRVLDRQANLNQRERYDVFVYDSTNIISIIALAIAVQPHNLNRMFDYVAIDISEPLDDIDFKDKRVCLLECEYNADTMESINKEAKDILVILSQGDYSVVRLTWDYFIGCTQPTIIEIIDDEELRKTLSRIDVTPNDKHTPLYRINPFIVEVMVGVIQDRSDAVAYTAISKLMTY